MLFKYRVKKQRGPLFTKVQTDSMTIVFFDSKFYAETLQMKRLGVVIDGDVKVIYCCAKELKCGCSYMFGFAGSKF
jgi:hypothetical protein